MDLLKEKEIFFWFVREYIFRKKPIGSKYLAKKIKNKLSAPSIRIYFRCLAEKGFLENLTNLKGRVPTDKGWYYYLENYPLSPEIHLNIKNLENIFEEITKITENIVIYQKENKEKIYGLKYMWRFFDYEDKNFLKDLFEFVEKFNYYKRFLEENKKILIGEKLFFSKSKNLSLCYLQKRNEIISIIGPKRNYYHTLKSLLNELEKIL